MSTLEKRFRRNFVVACVVHVVLIGGIVLFEGILNNAHSNASMPVELITPADILGDLPKGEGQGRGNYTAPPPETKAEDVATPAAPTAPPAAPVEPVAPKVKAPPPEVKSPDEVAIPKKPVTKEVKKTTDAPVEKVVASAKSTTNTVKTVISTKSSAKSSASGTAESATSFRQRFASALASAEGGTPGGNNRPAGGGTGESKYGRLGSPDGSTDGIAGGIGKGSQFWSYYMQIHDRMYEAWEQPGQAVGFDKKLVATVLLRIARNGRIEGVSLQHSSGNKLMDDSAVTAAHSVPRLDPLPEGLGGNFAEISVNFRLEG
jgi:TonB family protein